MPFTTARYAAERIAIWGFSLGTGVAVALASEQPVAKLILEAPYTSTVDVASAMLRVVPASLLRCAISFIRTSDPAIPIRFGERLFGMANEPKQFVRFPGGGHENLDDFGAIETARQFIGALKG